MPNPTAPHQTNQKIADAHTVLKLCTGKNKNSMGAKFKCGVQCNSACAVQEHSVFSPGWETLCKVHCYVQLRRMLYFCQGRNTNGVRWALIHSASFLPSSSLCLQPFQSSSSTLPATLPPIFLYSLLSLPSNDKQIALLCLLYLCFDISEMQLSFL